MKTEQKYIEDLSEIRLMMERSTKFLSLSGWSGIMAGIYAVVGAYMVYHLFYDSTEEVIFDTISRQEISGDVIRLILLGILMLISALGTAVYLSSRKAAKNNEILWNPVARRLVINMAIPLCTGGIFILILISKGIVGFIAPLTMIFYGLSLINASKFTFDELKYLGIIEIILGLVSAYFMYLGLLFWTVGFGVMHIIYGIYMHWRYER